MPTLSTDIHSRKTRLCCVHLVRSSHQQFHKVRTPANEHYYSCSTPDVYDAFVQIVLFVSHSLARSPTAAACFNKRLVSIVVSVRFIHCDDVVLGLLPFVSKVSSSSNSSGEHPENNAVGARSTQTGDAAVSTGWCL